MKVLTMALTMVLTVPLLAQEPTPPPEMQRLARLLVGSWGTNEKHEPGRIALKGGLGKGSERVDLGPGGMSLISDYRAVDPSGAFAAHTIMWWDAKEKAYHSLECTNRVGPLAAFTRLAADSPPVRCPGSRWAYPFRVSTDLLEEARKLSPRERLELIAALWDTLSDEDVPVTAEERDLLDARVADLEANPGNQSPWPEVKARLEQRRR